MPIWPRQAHQQGCLFCGGKLHRADYERKPRGGPEWDYRYSFCCAREGCRRRQTPPVGALPGAAGLCRAGRGAGFGHGAWPEARTSGPPARGVGKSTAAPWSGGGNGGWVTFVESSFWKAARARFMPPLCQQTLPRSLCLSFQVAERRDRLLELLKFLAPITTPAAWQELVM